jgi:quercetin dioxygenase-like cupin family protein
MPTRIVVTGVDESGTSRVRRDSPVTAEVVLQTQDGLRVAYPWQLPASPADLQAGAEPVSEVGEFLPPPEAIRFVQLEVPPPRANAAPDVADFVAELRDKLPGLLPTLVPEKGPGMHRTPTIDLITVVKGRILLALDDGSETELAPGDCVVQQGTVHAWRNVFSEPCLITGVIIPVAIAAD